MGFSNTSSSCGSCDGVSGYHDCSGEYLYPSLQIRTPKIREEQINCFRLALEPVIKCQVYFISRLGWRCLYSSNAGNWEIGKRTCVYVRNPAICSSNCDSDLSPAYYYTWFITIKTLSILSVTCPKKHSVRRRANSSWPKQWSECALKHEFWLPLI